MDQSTQCWIRQTIRTRRQTIFRTVDPLRLIHPTSEFSFIEKVPCIPAFFGITNDVMSQQFRANEEHEFRHLITSSARTKIDSGIFMPSALAGFEFTASLILSICSTGNSAGLVCFES